ncbi:MAG: alpha/beta fold hydrolase, partial [Kiritimatiellae bacterium]|nr:alpha/beta fold hydrolase [Kiritimatiellia bacterium]
MHKIILNIILALAANAATAAVTNDVAFIAVYDGSTQRYVEILPDGFDPARTNDLLVCLHGHGSDRWQYVNVVRGETSSARDIARERGMIFISPDYRATTSWMGPAAEADMLQILAALKQLYKVGRVIISGGSMGASSSLTFTALHPEVVDGVVALNGLADHVTYQNFQEAIAASFGGTKTEVPQEYYKRSALYFPERFSMPLAVTAGGLDTTVPPGSVLQLAETVSTHNPLVWIDFDPARGHSTDYAAAYAAYQFVVNTGLVANIAAPVNIAHWSFNVDESGVTDVTGNGHTLVNSGVTISNGIAVFKGSQTAFNTLQPLDLSPYTNLTVECYMRATAGSPAMVILEHTSQFNCNPGAFIATYNENNSAGQMMGGFCTATGTKLNLDTTAGKAADDGQWHHVAIVYDSAKTGADRSMFYLDGIAQGTYAAWTDGSATTLRNATLFIGSRNNTLSKYIGELDDIRITGAALSTNE